MPEYRKWPLRSETICPKMQQSVPISALIKLIRPWGTRIAQKKIQTLRLYLPFPLLRRTKEVCEKAYKSPVRPQVEYAAPVWSPWLAKDKTRIERMYIEQYSSVTVMLQSLNWETLQARRVKIRLCIIYKAYYNLAMFPLLRYATPATIHTRGHNIKFLLPHSSIVVY